ncbi:MAG: hypothetical protein ACREPH_13615 [Rhodanobacteraceae bacterium]
MHDRLDRNPMNHDPGKDEAGKEESMLAAALRVLPTGSPPRDLWPDLATRARRRHATRRAIWFTLPAAFAAGIALALVWPHPHTGPRAPVPAQIAAQPAARAPASNAPNLAALQANSTQWQAWVQTLARDGAPLNGQQLAQAVSLQDQIGLVDLQLSAARKPSTLAELWQQRITLLQQLGLLHLQPYRVAEQALAHPTHTISL